uniref:Secreted protein n=1 Tax=Rodentolepis nana TaxID=102285 RepID=A0A0R3TD07_RODNA
MEFVNFLLRGALLRGLIVQISPFLLSVDVGYHTTLLVHKVKVLEVVEKQHRVDQDFQHAGDLQYKSLRFSRSWRRNRFHSALCLKEISQDGRLKRASGLPKPSFLFASFVFCLRWKNPQQYRDAMSPKRSIIPQTIPTIIGQSGILERYFPGTPRNTTICGSS